MHTYEGNLLTPWLRIFRCKMNKIVIVILRVPKIVYNGLGLKYHIFCLWSQSPCVIETIQQCTDDTNEDVLKMLIKTLAKLLIPANLTTNFQIG